jgi:predicted transposase YdaD
VATYDRSSKWLIEHHGDSILRMAGVGAVQSWRALQAEVIQPGQLPDGLIEAILVGETEPRLYIIEIATYPERRAVEQLYRDALLVLLDRKVLPELIVIVLCPRGNLRVASRIEFSTPSGNTRLSLDWKVVELWSLSAEELLAVGDPGLAPWITLCATDKAPEELLHQCRQLVDRNSSTEERKTLLTVAQVLASLRYNHLDLLKLLGGRNAMIESPLLDQLRAEFGAEARAEGRAEGHAQGRAKDILLILRRRFGSVGDETEAALRSVRSDERLDDLLNRALDCDSLVAFDQFLRS